MSECKVPDDWKTANVTPIFRKDEASNYQPVSLMSHVYKILELFIKDSSVDYINENDPLNDTQHSVSKRSRARFDIQNNFVSYRIINS